MEILESILRSDYFQLSTLQLSMALGQTANQTINQTMVIEAETQALRTFRYFTFGVALFRIFFPVIAGALVLVLSANTDFPSYLLTNLQSRLATFFASVTTTPFLSLVEAVAYTLWLGFLISHYLISTIADWYFLWFGMLPFSFFSKHVATDLKYTDLAQMALIYSLFGLIVSMLSLIKPAFSYKDYESTGSEDSLWQAFKYLFPATLAIASQIP